MRPLFTVHAGEYLVGAYIERHFKNVQVWIPLKDVGIDLLVSDRTNRRTVSLQVKFSKDFLVTHMRPEFREALRACGWWTINRSKLVKSPADYWVFVLQGFASRSTDYVLVPRLELIRFLERVHGRPRLYQLYIWATEGGSCWETRGLPASDQRAIAEGRYRDSQRDLAKWLNKWAPVKALNQ